MQCDVRMADQIDNMNDNTEIPGQHAWDYQKGFWFFINQ